MLYLVECQKEKSNEFITLFPEGVEAANSKNAVKIVISSLGGSSSKEGVFVNGAEKYHNFHAKPKKWEAYAAPMTPEIKKGAFENDIINELKQRGFDSELCYGGIRVKTGVDTWIIDVREAHDEDAQMILYHKNNWNGIRDKNSRIPGFYKQISGIFTVDAIVGYMLRHELKWKANRVHHKDKGGAK